MREKQIKMSTPSHSTDNKGKVTLADARALLNDAEISDEELEKLLENLREFCSIIYQVHKKIKQNSSTKNAA